MPKIPSHSPEEVAVLVALVEAQPLTIEGLSRRCSLDLATTRRVLSQLAGFGLVDGLQEQLWSATVKGVAHRFGKQSFTPQQVAVLGFLLERDGDQVSTDLYSALPQWGKSLARIVNGLTKDGLLESELKWGRSRGGQAGKLVIQMRLTTLGRLAARGLPQSSPEPFTLSALSDVAAATLLAVVARPGSSSSQVAHDARRYVTTQVRDRVVDALNQLERALLIEGERAKIRTPLGAATVPYSWTATEAGRKAATQLRIDRPHLLVPEQGEQAARARKFPDDQPGSAPKLSDPRA